MSRLMPGVKLGEPVSNLHEAGLLALDSTLASETFGWRPNWDTSEVIEKTAEWYRAFIAGEKLAYDLCIEQIDSWLASETRNLRG